MDTITRIEEKSLRLKRNLFVTNVISFTLAGYFFMRHNSYCEPGGKYKKTIFMLFYSKTFKIIYFSVHIVCPDRIFGGAYKYGFPHDCLLGFS